MKLTLGPVLFNWPTPLWREFYDRIADEAPVDRVIVGEAVCSKRWPFRTDAMGEVVERLERGGKEVVVTTLALPTLKREVAQIAEQLAAPYLTEVNDITAVALLDGRPCLLGPLVNVYNEDALATLAELGVRGVCLPAELPLGSVKVIAERRGSVEIEVFAFGRAPLALSARCYHARAHGLAKDGCRYVCEQDLDGLEVETLDDQPFLAINGIQTLASGVTVLSGELDELAAAGVTRLRLSPHSCDMVEVARLYRQLADRRIGRSDLLAAIDQLGLPGRPVNGYLHGAAGAAWIE